MAAAARLFGDACVALADLNRLVKSAERKIIRMPEAVRSFGVIFPDNVGRRVTIVTRRDVLVARLDPAVILVVHNVAVRARRGIIAEVGITLGVNECVNADAECQSECCSNDDEF